MEEFLRYLIVNLVGPTEGMELTQSHARDKVLFRLKLPPAELGRIIGKQGRTVQAIRNLLSAAGERQGQKVLLQIVEE